MPSFSLHPGAKAQGWDVFLNTALVAQWTEEFFAVFLVLAIWKTKNILLTCGYQYMLEISSVLNHGQLNHKPLTCRQFTQEEQLEAPSPNSYISSAFYVHHSWAAAKTFRNQQCNKCQHVPQRNICWAIQVCCKRGDLCCNNSIIPTQSTRPGKKAWKEPSSAWCPSTAEALTVNSAYQIPAWPHKIAMLRLQRSLEGCLQQPSHAL